MTQAMAANSEAVGSPFPASQLLIVRTVTLAATASSAMGRLPRAKRKRSGRNRCLSFTPIRIRHRRERVKRLRKFPSENKKPKV